MNRGVRVYLWFYSFICGNCGAQYATSLSPFLLGSGRRRCKWCDTVFADGSEEWPQLKPDERFEYLFPTTVLGYVGGAALTVILVFFSAGNLQDKLTFEVASAIVMFTPCLPYFLWRWYEVRKSRHRHEQHLLSDGTDQSILRA
jgi:hypothetical protein